MKDYAQPRYVAALCCMIAMSAGSARAEQAGSVTTKIDLPYVSKYVWRGTVSNPDPALQPSLTLTHTSGLSVNLWASIDGTDINGQQGRATEIDYTANYAWTMGHIDMNAGLIDYTFPNTALPATKEVYASACLRRRLSPSISAYYDFDEANGFCFSASAAHTCAVPWSKTGISDVSFSARLSYATANYNKLYFGVAKSAFTDLLLSASLPITLCEMFTITPALSYSTVLDGRLRNRVTEPDNFFTSVTASVAF